VHLLKSAFETSDPQRRLVRRDLLDLRREHVFGRLFIQNAAPVLKNLPSRSAVSAVTGFYSRAMRSIWVRGHV